MSTTRRRLTALLTALFAIGLLGMILTAVTRPETASIKAAIVNDDQMVELDGQMVPMGRQLAAELMEQESRYTWEITTAALAEAGLKDGTYAAIVTIPKDFSAALTSLSSGDQVTQGRITVRARPGATDDERYVMEVVTRASTAALGGQVTEAFVTQMVGGLGDMHSQLGKAGEGAQQLADGALAAANGVKQLDEGAQQLATGGTAAAEGAGQLSDGAQQLSQGTTAAATGLQDLATGTGSLVDGLGDAATGAGQLSDGAQQLSQGTTAAATGLQDLATGTGSLVDGLGDAATGAQALADGTTGLATGLETLAQGATTAGSAAAEGVEEAGKAMADSIQNQFVDGNTSVLKNVVLPVAPYLQTILGYCNDNPDDALCTQLGTDGRRALGTLNGTIAAGHIDGLIAGGNSLHSTITGSFSTVAEGVLDGFDVYGQNISDASAGAQQLKDGAINLAAGLATATEQAAPLVTGAQQAADGVSQLADGASALAQGTQQAATGLTTATEQAAPLVTGAQQAADGVSQLADGASALAQGTQQAATGLTDLADGIDQLAEGSSQLADGSGQLADGSEQLAEGLTQAVEQIPTYSEEQLDQLVVGVTAPVETPTVQSGAIPNQAGSVFAILLWLATFALGLLFPAFVPHIVDSVRPASRLALQAWWIPATWSAVVGAAGGTLLGFWAQSTDGDLAGATVPALALLGALFGASFYAVQQALAASLGAGGRIVSLALAGLAVVAAVASDMGTAGAPLSSLAAYLPAGLTTTATNFLIVSGAPGGTVALVGVLAWGIGALVITVWATSRRRAKPH